MAAFSPDFLRELQEQVRGKADSHELTQKQTVTDEARAFIVGLVVESLIYRGPEWLQEHQLDVSDANQLMDVVTHVDGAINDLFSLSRAVQANHRSYVCVISLIEAIHKKWCGVWPFCRK